MTRVNVGIDPKELCDEHLVAEYRELPRCFSHRQNAGPKEFTLGAGHMLWCSRHFGSLANRFKLIVEEMRYRDITVNFPNPRIDTGPLWTSMDEERARPLLIERIRERLSTMDKKTWKKRTPPTWSQV